MESATAIRLDVPATREPACPGYARIRAPIGDGFAVSVVMPAPLAEHPRTAAYFAAWWKEMHELLAAGVLTLDDVPVTARPAPPFPLHPRRPQLVGR